MKPCCICELVAENTAPCPSGARFICRECIEAHPEVPDDCEKCRTEMVRRIEKLVGGGMDASHARKIVQNALNGDRKTKSEEVSDAA